MTTATTTYDYDILDAQVQQRIADLVKEDNLDFVNQEIEVPTIKYGFYAKYGKRIIDIVVSVIVLIVALPINAIIALITFFDVGSPILFRQIRVGKDHQRFVMVKFRNMTNAVDENGILLRADLRITKWGRFVRKTSADELLNFINILKGEMSIIGPRPLPIVYEGRYNKLHDLRHAVKPGLDCPLRDPSKLMTWQNRFDNDVWYAQNVSFATDVKLVFLLVRETLFGKDKEARAKGFSEGSFIGYYPNGSVMDSNNIPKEYYERAGAGDHAFYN